MTQSEESYPAFPVAILNSLSFLDFKMIDPDERAAAIEKYEIKGFILFNFFKFWLQARLQVFISSYILFFNKVNTFLF